MNKPTFKPSYPSAAVGTFGGYDAHYQIIDFELHGGISYMEISATVGGVTMTNGATGGVTLAKIDVAEPAMVLALDQLLRRPVYDEHTFTARSRLAATNAIKASHREATEALRVLWANADAHGRHALKDLVGELEDSLKRIFDDEVGTEGEE